MFTPGRTAVRELKLVVARDRSIQLRPWDPGDLPVLCRAEVVFESGETYLDELLAWNPA